MEWPLQWYRKHLHRHHERDPEGHRNLQHHSSPYELSVIKNGNGSGTVIGPAGNDGYGGINCGNDYSESYNSRTQVTLTASFNATGSARDNFDRADGPLGSNWTRSPGNTESGAIRSNTVGMEDQFTSRRADYYNAMTFSGDQYSQVDISVLPALTAGAAVRMQSGADSYYVAGFDNNEFSGGAYHCRIWKWINSASTSLAFDSNCVIAAGDTLLLEVQGSTLSFYQAFSSSLQLTHRSLAAVRASSSRTTLTAPRFG